MSKAIHFQVNKSLAYLIQQVTKDSTQEILSYFYGIATFVSQDVWRKSKAHYVNKDIILFYKETPITFKIKMHFGRVQEAEERYCDISVGFPSQVEDQEVGDLMTKVMETGLGLIEEEELPKFEKPILKTPACLRDVRIKQNESR